MADHKTRETKTVTMFNRAMYEKLERIVSRTTVSDMTTPIQAAHQLGVQHVLRIIREGFYVDQ